jgi:pyruvate,water dikinase
MSAPRWVYHFDDPPPTGEADLPGLLGGKGSSLRAMTQAGLHVPPGFTITTECCRRYFELGRRWPDDLDRQLREHLARLEAQTGRTFGQGRRPLLVSVRSGAARSMPGMMDTLLNCGLHPDLAADPPQGVGDSPRFWRTYAQFVAMFTSTVHGVALSGCDKAADGDAALALLGDYQRQTGEPFPTDPWDALVACINAVFDSWHNERAVAYRNRHNIRDLHGTAVNVQVMFASQVSGIAFSQDPNDIAAGQMIVEAAYGLGEAVVSGEVTPDRYIVRRGDFAIASRDVGDKAAVVLPLGDDTPAESDAPCLSDEQVVELARLVLRVEEHFGHPVDVEWGWADGQFTLLQARAIRGLEVAGQVERARQDEIDRLAELVERAGGRRRVWIEHNLGETLRWPTPLTWDIVRRFMTGSGGFGRMYRQLGYRPSQRVCAEGFLELIGGRVYADPQRLGELFWDGMPLVYDTDAVVGDPSLLDRAPAKFDPDRADGRFLLQLPANLHAMWRIRRNVRRGMANANQRFDAAVREYQARLRQIRQAQLDGLSDTQLIAEIDRRRAVVLDEFGPESLLPGLFGGMAYDGLEAMLGQLLGHEAGAAMAATLTAGLEDTTTQQDALLHDVARGNASLEAFIEQFGHRCVGEMELGQPRWREDPTYLEQTIGRLRRDGGRDPRAMHAENVARRDEAERSLPNQLCDAGGSALLERIQVDLADARALLPYRETGKHYLMMGYELIRQAIESLAQRWGLVDDDIYFLHFEELAGFTNDRARLAEQVARRRLRWQAFQRLDMADVIDSDELDRLGQPPEAADGAELAGTAVAAGAATGVARIVLRPDEAGDLGTDYVLVCPSTDPGWTPLFLGARGLIVERGGVLSHGAIVARDFGIPAVVCPGATRILDEGERITLDGNRGRIIRLEREARHG